MRSSRSVLNEGKSDANESPGMDRGSHLPCPTTTASSVDRPSRPETRPSSSCHSSSRLYCPTCERPQARACLCSALPATPWQLSRCHCLVLQHPHETRRKNRSLFLAELSLSKTCLTKVRGRALRYASSATPDHVKQLLAADRPVWLVSPHPQAVSLREALAAWRGQQRQQQQPQPQPQETTTASGGDPFHPANNNNNKAPPPLLTIIFLDATWKFARQMEKASVFPPHTQRVQLTPAHDLQSLPQLQRFDIRTPPSPAHLCSAECLALVVSRVEERPALYESLMRPLDFMVAQWHSFRTSTSSKQQTTNQVQPPQASSSPKGAFAANSIITATTTTTTEEHNDSRCVMGTH